MSDRPLPSHKGPIEQPKLKLGLVSMIIAIVGFVFALIPGALIIGWVLLPVGFILGIVALIRPGKNSFAIWAIVISVMGTIVGVFVFMSLTTKAVSDAFDQATKTTVEVTQSAEGPSETPTESDDGQIAGTRGNPVPIGSTITGPDWTVVVNSIDMDATAAVLEANPFNDEPAEGTKYMTANISATYTGDDSSSDALVSVAFVATNGEVFASFDSFTVAPEPQFGTNELYSGATATGNVAIQIPVDTQGELRVSPGILADEVFVATAQ